MADVICSKFIADSNKGARALDGEGGVEEQKVAGALWRKVVEEQNIAKAL